MGILTDGGKTMKTKRQNEIIRLITNGDIETQEELASELRTLGYKVTQATVSRDIRELRLIKVAAKDGGFKYAKPERHEIAVSERLTRILTDSLVSVDASGNLIVVKTLSGSANVIILAGRKFSERLQETIRFLLLQEMKQRLQR